MGSLRPLWGSPNLEGLLVAFAVVIVKLLSNMSLHSLQNAGAKLHKFFRKQAIIDKNIKFLCIYWAK